MDVKIVFVGEEAAGARALQRVVDSDHELIAVLTAGSSAGPGASVASIAAGAGVPVLPARRVREPDLVDELRALGVDVLLNVHSLHVVRAEVLAAPRVGAFNLHPGPLPQYAGLNAPSWALLEGREQHGVTLHWMEPGIDTGDVVARTDFAVGPTDTGLTVSLRCAEEGLRLVDDLLARLSEGAEIPRQPQDPAERRYFGREVPHDGWIPWARPAREVLDFVRAFDYRPFTSPWGTPRTTVPEIGEVGVGRLAGTDRAADPSPGTVQVDGDGTFVATGDDWVQVLGVRADGRARPPGAILTGGVVVGG